MFGLIRKLREKDKEIEELHAEIRNILQREAGTIDAYYKVKKLANDAKAETAKWKDKYSSLYEKHLDLLERYEKALEGVFSGEGIATVKLDGSCCAIIGGKFYKRFDAKRGKKVPEGAIPCSDPDPITGHHPHWVPVDENAPGDKWFIKAKNNVPFVLSDGTYEAVGPHFNGNKQHLPMDLIERHGNRTIYVERSFEGIKNYLKDYSIEGIVFWKDGEPRCKIKRSDFGFEW